ncbi:OB-fold protein [Flagellimonas meridianipacifica]|uniref:Uncharacterized protein n=1 Tax=Flagellimonas meridianipacifica TaxID=1080225 RepID=A0A2T0MK08_9FLAO|nr:hypothetical protein [Allomuricauda pacifica]PRX57912.1 hypothetical protein CLV81_1926 [Allomuricauda pacifica]
MKAKKRISIILSGVLIVVVFAFLALNYMYKPHRNIAEERAISSLSAIEIHEKFTNPNTSLENLADKIVEVNGSITEIEQVHTIFIDNKVQVDFDTLQQVKGVFDNGSNITIKGRCVGFDDLLEIVKIDQAILINNQ